MENKKSRVSESRAYILGLSVWALALVLALSLGAVDSASIDIILQVRLPRVILATSIGMGLSVAGASLQALFSNPLCEPYTLGISSGAALGAVIGAALKFEWMMAGLTGSAFAGSAVFAVILYLVSRRPGSTNMTLLLTGIMLGFLGSSLVTVWMALAEPNGIQTAMLWLFGDLSRARLKGALFTLFGIFLLVFQLWKGGRALDGLLLGEETASSLGIDVSQTRQKVILLTSLLIGLTVSAGGMIGFVGLIVPHFGRRFVGALHSRLIPLCAIWGAAALVIADWLSRTIVRPNELPVGVITAIVGAPVFLGVMLKSREISRA